MRIALRSVHSPYLFCNIVHRYAYLKASCVSMSLKNIEAITYFKHLQFVDISDNSLTIEAMQCLAKLPYLLLIHADRNNAVSAVFKRMKYLQVIIMNNNKITDVFEVYQPRLSTLELGHNKIKTLEFRDKMQTLKCLDLRSNLLKDIKQLDLPNLDSLYLASNKIKSLEGIDRLVNLRILHLRDNPIKNLNGFGATNEKLKYINLRKCKIRSLTQIRKLMVRVSIFLIVARHDALLEILRIPNLQDSPAEKLLNLAVAYDTIKYHCTQYYQDCRC